MQSAAVHRQSELDDLINRLDLSLVEPDPDYDWDDEADNMPSPLDPDKAEEVVGNIKDTLPSPSATASLTASQSGKDAKQLPDKSTDQQQASVPQQQNNSQIRQVQQFQRQPSLPQPLQQSKQSQQFQRQPSLPPSTQQTKQGQQLQRQPSLHQPEQQKQQPEQRTAATDDDKKSAGRFDIFRKLRGSTTDASAEMRKSKRRKTLEQLKVSGRRL